MIKREIRFGIAPDAQFGQTLRGSVKFQEPTPSRWAKARQIIAYTALVAGVGLAVFVAATPAHSAGSMASDVRVIEVSPSITYLGDTREGRRLQADTIRDKARFEQRQKLQQDRSIQQRALEADRAYYKKLEFQRKMRGY